VVYGYWPCHAEGEELVLLDPVHKKAEVARLRFPRQPDERLLCLADFFRTEPGSDLCALQVVTVGDAASRVADEANARGDYSRGLFVHGLAVEVAEALAEHWHRVVRSELSMGPDLGKRYSPGYPSWPELADQRQLWKLLDPERTIGVSLTEACQMVPEQSTSAIVLHHPEAVYFTIRGQSVLAG
jgi:5-methyltetrahydrofolate--homocysteine methyltransferase